MRRTSTITVVLSLSVALALGGCSADGGQQGSGSSEPSSSSAAAAGETVSGTGYSYRIPEGWGIPEGDLFEGADSYAADLQDTDDFADNVNVIISPAGEISADDIETAGVEEFEATGVATEIEVQDRVQIAGGESAHLTAVLTSGNVTYRIEQYYPTHDGTTYIVTFSLSESVPEAERQALADSVLASWEWE